MLTAGRYINYVRFKRPHFFFSLLEQSLGWIDDFVMEQSDTVPSRAVPVANRT